MLATRTPVTADPFAEFYPCDAEVQADSFDKLSAAERMLAIGYKVSGGEKGPYSRYDHGVKPVSFMADFIGQFYFRNGRMPVNTEEMFRYMDEQSGRVDSAGLYQLLVSPVTVKPLEWNHESFSRGNAFITVINDNPEALSVAEARHEQLEKKYPKNIPEGVKLAYDPDAPMVRIHVYCRVYGERGVIDRTVKTFEWPEDGYLGHE